MAKDRAIVEADRKVKFFNEKLDPEAYNHVARESGLATIQMLASKFDVSPLFFSEKFL